MKKVSLSSKFSYSVLDEPIPEIVEHINNTVLGTPGRLRYQLGDVEKKMKALKSCHYLTLWREERLLGTIGFVRKSTCFGDRTYDSWYLRYFSIIAPLRSDRHGKEHERRRKPSAVGNMLKELGVHYVGNPDSLLGGRSGNKKSLVYGYIEKDNFRSQQFGEVGEFGSPREFCTLLFNRFRPRLHKNVSRITDRERPEVTHELDKFYRNHTLFSTDHIFWGGNYLVYKEQGEIVAGLQANPETWRMMGMTGFSGALFLKILPRVPGMSAILDPHAFRFVALEGIFHKKGREDCLIPLVETACRLNGMYQALAWLDTEDPLLKTFDTLDRYGIFNRFFRRIPADIKIRLNGFDGEDDRIFREHPAYISCFDMT